MAPGRQPLAGAAIDDRYIDQPRRQRGLRAAEQGQKARRTENAGCKGGSFHDVLRVCIPFPDHL